MSTPPIRSLPVPEFIETISSAEEKQETPDHLIDIFTELKALSFKHSASTHDALFQQGFLALKKQTKEFANDFEYAYSIKGVDKYSKITPNLKTVVTFPESPQGRLSGNYMPNGCIAMSGVTLTNAFTLADFVLERKIGLIIRLTPHMENGKEKSYDWTSGLPLKAGNSKINVDIKNMDSPIELAHENAQFLQLKTKTFELEKRHSTWKVKELFLDGWKDGEATPPRGLIEAVKILRKEQENLKKELEGDENYAQLENNQINPVSYMVHCSAGVGRTGTFLAIDMIMKELDEGREPDVPQIIFDLRRARHSKMVDSWQQLKLCYAAKQEYQAEVKARLPLDALKV